MEGSLQTFSNDFSAKHGHLNFVLSMGGPVAKQQLEYNGWLTMMGPLLADWQVKFGMNVDLTDQVESLTQAKLHNCLMLCQSLRDTADISARNMRDVPSRLIDNSIQHEVVMAELASVAAGTNRIRSLLTRAKSDVLMPPPLNNENLLQVTDDSDHYSSQNESEFENVVGKLTKRRKRLQKRGERANIQAAMPVVPLPPANLAEHIAYDDGIEVGTGKPDDIDDDFRIVARNYKMGYFLEPEVNAPYLNDKKVKWRSVPAEKRKDVVWKPIRDAQLYKFSECDPEMLRAMCSEGFFPRAVLDDALQQGVANLGKITEPRGIALSEAPTKISQELINNAELCYWWGQIEKLFMKEGLLNKMPFINKWMKRLLGMPSQLLNATPSVAQKLYFILRHNSQDKAAINKTFRGFVTAMLASWKHGEHRSEYVKRASKSLDCYWGNYATNYVKIWEGLDWNNYQVKPSKKGKVETTFKRLRAAASSLTERVQKTVDRGLELSRDAIEEMSDELEQIDKATKTLGAWAKIKMMGRRAKLRVKRHFANNMDEQSVKIKTGPNSYLQVESTGIATRLVGFLRATVGAPFWYVTTEEVIDFDTKEAIPVKKCTVRPWLKSLYGMLANFGAKSDVPEADGRAVPFVLREPIRAVSGITSIIVSGLQYTIRKTGGWFYGQPEATTIEEIEAAEIKPAYARAASGILGSAIIGAGLAASIAIQGGLIAAKVGGFFFGATATEAVIETAVKPALRDYKDIDAEVSAMAEGPSGAIQVRGVPPPPQLNDGVEITIADLRQRRDMVEAANSLAPVDETLIDVQGGPDRLAGP